MRREMEKWCMCVLERKEKGDGEGKVVDWCVDEKKREREREGHLWRMREKEWENN